MKEIKAKISLDCEEFKQQLNDIENQIDRINEKANKTLNAQFANNIIVKNGVNIDAIANELIEKIKNATNKIYV